ncbi:DUF1801 domain-containing protein [Yeosuana marina]|uniref:DUF1801 domain-containing protein n=1 Tax=Yeosuana marina TaxID=1565536 RepID=UPI0030EF7C5E|tara:strand:+ start:660 stop:1088 length:429 start_codon:yes stop_codon:yes gene_type:complete
MKDLQIKTNSQVEIVFNNYPDSVRNKMLALRNLIIETAQETEEVKIVEETLKWGEPSYLAKTGSTIRIDWKSKSPNQYAMYFQCTSRLVETFKLIFNNTFNFEGKRAIIFTLDDKIPTTELKYCIKSALIYHKVKHLPLLGL